MFDGRLDHLPGEHVPGQCDHPPGDGQPGGGDRGLVQPGTVRQILRVNNCGNAKKTFMKVFLGQTVQ